MNLRLFLKQGNIDLLPNSAANWKVGYQFEWDRPILKHRADVTLIYISNEFYAIANDPNIFSQSEKDTVEASFNAINAEALVDANINTIDVDKKHDFRTMLNLPDLGVDIQGGFNYQVLKNFVIEGVTYKALSGDAYSLLQESLIALKRNNKPTYRKVKDLAYIEQLWYASKFSVKVEQQYAADLDAKLRVQGTDFELSANVDGEGYKKLNINLKANCPFGAKIKALGDLVN